MPQRRLQLGIQTEWETPVTPKQWQTWFETWLKALSVRDPCELSLCLTGDEQIKFLNGTYRQLDMPTDVLAFAAEESAFPLPGPVRLLGDIVISVPTAARQAQEQGHSLTHELAWLAAHGLLHLLGWDHPDLPQLAAMLAQQQHLLAQVQLPIAPTVLHSLLALAEE